MEYTVFITLYPVLYTGQRRNGLSGNQKAARLSKMTNNTLSNSHLRSNEERAKN